MKKAKVCVGTRRLVCLHLPECVPSLDDSKLPCEQAKSDHLVDPCLLASLFLLLDPLFDQPAEVALFLSSRTS